jgi:L-seryl-tRNA(Ser) seleniumtransferase
VAHAAGPNYAVEAVPMFSQIGSGALPVDQLPSYGLALRYAGAGRPGRHLDKLEARLRGLPVPVIGRIEDDALWLDLRCLEAPDETAFAAQLAEPLA